MDMTDRSIPEGELFRDEIQGVVFGRSTSVPSFDDGPDFATLSPYLEHLFPYKARC
jgi:hypothetical protein